MLVVTRTPTEIDLDLYSFRYDGQHLDVRRNGEKWRRMRNPVSRGRFSFSVPSTGTSLPDIEPVKPIRAPESVVVSPPPAKKSRHDRRRDKAFNRRLKKRLEADGTPVNVEVLEDGGLHVTVKKEES